MNLKSLLSAALVVSASVSAYAAAPAYESIYPPTGYEATAAQGICNINITYDWGEYEGKVKVNDDAQAVLENLEDGKKAYSTSFNTAASLGMDYTIIIKFDEADIKSNGQWQLTVPAGSYTVAGEANDAITAVYTVNDPLLAAGDFKAITLEKITPTDGSDLAMWGGDLLTELKFETSDDAAVNYIEWTLYDVTNGEGEDQRQYIRQGNDNRYDVNRYHDEEDHFKDGLFCAISGKDYLVKGNKYMVTLRFCGIGYDVATNQYPSPDQLNASELLVTNVYYNGATPAPEYSPNEVVEISPDPEEYEIDNPELGIFTVTFAGPVKPSNFIYSVGMGLSSSAGTFEAIEPNDKGFASKWTFTIDKDILAINLGRILVSFTATDENGLPVKGNGGYLFDDYIYGIMWDCNCGAYKILSVEPEAFAEVSELSKIVVAGEGDREINYSYVTSEKATITTMDREVIRTLDEPVQSEDAKSYTWTFDPITEPGTYILNIPKQYFNIGTEFDSTTANATNFTYYVINPEAIVYDLAPETVKPADKATLDELSEIVVEFAEATFAVQYLDNEDKPLMANLYSVDEDGKETIVESIEPVDISEDFLNPTTYKYTLAEKITGDGAYKFVIAKGTFGDGTFADGDQTKGHTNDEIVINYILGHGPGGGIANVIAADSKADVYTLQGTCVLRGASADDLKNLAKGIYIVNGKKLVVTE